MSDDKTKARGGRPRKGTIELRGGTWKARLTLPDGSRRWFPLGTTDKNAARRKLKKLVADQAAGSLPAPEEAKAPETVDSYARSWLEGRERRELPSASNERRTYEHVWRPAIGKLGLTDVHGGLIQSVISEAVEGRLVGLRGEPYSRQSIMHIRATILRMFEAAWREELIRENPAKRTQVPEMDEEHLPRAVLTDGEIGQLISHPHVNPEIKLLVLLGRCIGGLRTGDLNRLDWQNFSPGFEVCAVVRRKTRKKRSAPIALEVPEVVRPFLDAWWRAAGCPAAGVVFPARRGARAGQPKKAAKQSYAPRLRKALQVAFGLVLRTDEGWTKADRPLTPREQELLHGSATVQAVDFHSTRRAYATALARVGVNEQTAMALTGHADSKVHRLYLEAANIRALPAAAVPAIDPGSVAVFAANQNRPKRGTKPEPTTKKPASAARQPAVSTQQSGAGEEIRTLDVHLGKREPGAESSTKHADSLPAMGPNRPPETSVNRGFCPSGWGQNSEAEADLFALLKSRADRIAQALVNAPGGST